MERKDYYNGARIFGSNCWFNASLGNRSIGKSFCFKRYCIRKFLEEKRKFIYIRRRDVELKEAVPVFFDDISIDFPGYSLTTKKNNFYLNKVEYDPESGESEIVDVNHCGYFTHLGALPRLKSMPLQDVDTIFFDEFLPDDGRYLRQYDLAYEPQLLLNLYMTVARGVGQPIRPDVKIICAANTTSFYNPYFSFFGIKLINQKVYKRDGMLVEFTLNTKAADEIRQTDFGKVLERTAYGQYALNNQSLLDINSQIASVPHDARPYCQLYFNDWYAAFMHPTGVYWKKTYDSTFTNNYKLIDSEITDGLPWFSGGIVQIFKELDAQGDLYYHSMEEKSVLAGFFYTTPTK